MLARISDSVFARAICFALLASVALLTSSCATKAPPPLVSDGVTGRESSLPWNAQQKWENTGQLGALADQMQTH
ncbi:MAG: hypothetical protein M3Y86_04230 [Verrucomicrobiota bacterium]|nr:hypothetical protein [Verrucomicrobiota bacterium]